MDSSNKIFAITLGIRYARSFRIPDLSGEIVDEILYGDKTPFGTELYPTIQEPLSREKILSNPETDEYFRINTDDLIIGIKIKNKLDERFNWLSNEVVPYLEENIFNKYKIKNIIRVGIIFHHKFPKNSKLKDIVSEITNDSVKDSENISFRFSKKLQTFEAVVRKTVNDHRNTIYIFNESPKSLFAAIDYQHYFDPIVEDIRDCGVKKIITNAKDFLSSYYYPWLSTYEKTGK